MSFQKNHQIILNELNDTLTKISDEEINNAICLINNSSKIFFHALGRAGFMGKSFIMRLMHMGKETYVLGETNTPNFESNDLLIICFGSGETAQFIQLAKKAQSLGGKVLAFTGTPKSTLDKLSDCSIIIPAPSKKQKDNDFYSVQPMASLFEQSVLLTGDTIILTMMEQGPNGNEMFHRHSNLE